MGEVIELETAGSRPHSVNLVLAIQTVINEIAPEHMTALEVLGVLSYITMDYHEKALSMYIEVEEDD